MVRSVVFLFAVVLLALLAVVFALSNTGTMEIDLAFGKYEVKTAIAFIVTVVIGWVWGVLSVTGYVFRLWSERRRLRKQIRVANLELNNLRALPMHDAS